ncbi:hypothetical protein BASA81_013391 [Batrachochytrium salamandrivorans]|nr:hypothetical protein BASA81_013391 [Batrachochytrium salamandrivorans]
MLVASSLNVSQFRLRGIFRIGSTTPGAILFDAREHFEKESPKCDENIRSIRGQLMEAVILMHRFCLQ